MTTAQFAYVLATFGVIGAAHNLARAGMSLESFVLQYEAYRASLLAHNHNHVRARKI
jgi:hypothetical protein